MNIKTYKYKGHTYRCPEIKWKPPTWTEKYIPNIRQLYFIMGIIFALVSVIFYQSFISINYAQQYLLTEVKLSNKKLENFEHKNKLIKVSNILEETSENLKYTKMYIDEIINKKVELLFKVDHLITDLVDYVLKNSDGLDRDTAREIVIITLKNTKYPLLQLAIFTHESRYDRHALSSVNARGLGQIHPVNFDMLKKEGIIAHEKELFEYEPNIKASDYILRRHIKYDGNGDIKKGLYGYVGGNVPKYVNGVLKHWEILKGKLNIEIFEIKDTIEEIEERVAG